MPETGEIERTINLSSPIVATAIHNGHHVRAELAPLLAIPESERLHEEDPFTSEFARVAPSWLIGERSRFEVDLNRPRDHAVYRGPDEAWGLDIWRDGPPDSVIKQSLAEYDEFYDSTRRLLERLLRKYERIVVLDLHSYNHRRGGPRAAPDDPALNPEVNVGTGSMNRAYWGRLVDRFIADLHGYPYQGRHLDVRENVKFLGGHLCQWIHRMFPRRVCAIAVEFKKCFMDEWTGAPDRERLHELSAALRSTCPGLLDSLEEMHETSAPAGARRSCS